MGILAFILNNKTLLIGIVLAVIIAGMGVSIKVLRSERDTALAQKETAETLLIESQANVVQLQNDIEFQNSEIKKFKEAADRRFSENAAIVAKAQKDAAAYKKQAADILSRVSPENLSKCDAANLLIIEELRNEK